MELLLENIGCISEANIKVDGFTVLTGTNASGKSTLLKTLYSITESPHASDQKIENALNMELRKYNRRSSTSKEKKGSKENDQRMIVDMLNEMLNDKSEEMQRFFDKNELENYKIYLESGTNLSYFLEKFLDSSLEEEFSGQFFKIGSRKAHVKLSDDDKIYAEILKDDNDIKIKNLTESFNSMYYIDSPYVLDSIVPFFFSRGLQEHRGNLSTALSGRSSGNGTLNKTNVEKVVEIMSKAFKGSFRRTNAGLLYDSEEAKGVLASNLASGMKILSIIRLLIENGSLYNGSLLLIDEPEIHLHPEWQLVLAEVLVYLKKELGITIVMTTHSPHFLMAIQKYSKEEGIHVDYYMAETRMKKHYFTDVSDNTEKIYSLMVEAMEKVF